MTKGSLLLFYLVTLAEKDSDGTAGRNLDASEVEVV